MCVTVCRYLYVKGHLAVVARSCPAQNIQLSSKLCNVEYNYFKHNSIEILILFSH